MALTIANIDLDTVQDAGISKQYTVQGLLSYAQIDRSVMVRGLTAAGVTPSLATGSVLALLQATVPIGTPHPTDPQCSARFYSVRPTNSDDALQGIVSYVFNTPGGDQTQWTVESDSYVEVVSTDAQYDPTDATQTRLVPIPISNYLLNWQTYQTSSGAYNPPPIGQTSTDANGNPVSVPVQPATTVYASVTVPKFQKQWTYSRDLYSLPAAQAFDNGSVQYVGRVNSVTFTGLTSGPAAQNLSCAPGTVFCTEADLTVSVTSGRCSCRCVLAYKPEGWQPYVEYENPQLGGRPPNLWRAGMIGGQAFQANGIVRTSAIPAADLNGLLSLVSAGPALPFGGDPLAPVT